MLSFGARGDVRSWSANHLYYVDLCTLWNPEIVDGRYYHKVLSLVK